MVLNRHVTARDLVSKDKMILEWRGWGGVEQTLGPQMPLYSQLEGIGSSVGTVGGSTGARCSSFLLSFKNHLISCHQQMTHYYNCLIRQQDGQQDPPQGPPYPLLNQSQQPAGLLPVIMQQQMQTSQNQITFPKAHDTEARTIFLAIIMYCNFARLEVQPGKIPNSPGYTFHSPEIARSPKEARTFP
ncbi:hypothetical protein Tco_0521953 [Tanacetum coccineum]